jgi:nicotinate-nucleotide adenylyltransferase
VQSRNERVGVYGGTFDPVHEGHLGIARMALKTFALDRIIFSPAFHAPHRKRRAEVSAFHRAAMLALAIQDEPRFRLSDAELRAGKVVYTIDTMMRLRRRFGRGVTYFFILGSDSLRDVPTWRDYRRLLEVCCFLVFTRQEALLEEIRRSLPMEIAARIRVLSAGDREIGEPPGPGFIYFVRNKPIELSASRVRDDLRAGRDVRTLLPESVRLYIERHGLYSGAKIP